MAQVDQNQANIEEEKKNNDSPSKQIMSKLIFEKIPAKDLHLSSVGGWLQSRFHFRFANWRPSDPKKRGFGNLHVLNDDIVEPKNGFGFHPHRDQEIFSYILSGNLTHEDSEGNKETLGRGHIQYMSAGSGVWHSELNNNKTEQCRFLQTWIYPNKKNLNVQYGSYQFKEEQRKNKLLHIINGEDKNGKMNGDKNDNVPIRLHQDVNVFVSELDYGNSIEYELKDGRQAYLVCPEGSVNINNMVELETRAAVRLYGEAVLNIVATHKVEEDAEGPSAHIMMIEMEMEKK